MKTCSTCYREKPLDEYSVHATGKDGLRGQCKDCVRTRKNRQAAEYRARPDVKKSKAAYNAQHVKTPAQYRAWLDKKNDRQKAKRQSDPAYRLRMQTSHSVRQALIDNLSGSFKRLTYSKEQLVAHLLSTMPRGYTRDDLAQLHIDHIIPFKCFKLTGRTDAEFHSCWALDNLQLLPAEANVAKSDSTTWIPHAKQ